MLGLMGGVVGVGIAYLSVRFFDGDRASESAAVERDFGGWTDAAVWVRAFGAVGTLVWPDSGTEVWKVTRSRVGAVAGRTSSASRERHRARNILVVGQVAMAVVLLVCAGLMVRTFEAMRNVRRDLRMHGPCS